MRLIEFVKKINMFRNVIKPKLDFLLSNKFNTPLSVPLEFVEYKKTP